MTYDAFSFETQHDLVAVRSLIGEEGSSAWRGGDSEVWGAYLVTRLPVDGTRLRIFLDDGRFVIDLAAADEPALERARELVRLRILPCLQARDVRPHPGWE